MSQWFSVRLQKYGLLSPKGYRETLKDLDMKDFRDDKIVCVWKRITQVTV